jgi:uncharacterized protein (DUF111 family)
VLLEANLDDMNPELMSYAAEVLWERGALDVFMTPVFMKKNRSGTLLSVLVTRDRMEDVISALFDETTTLGVRAHAVERRKLRRESLDVETRFGRLGVKVGRVGGRVANIAPEYEDCREAARKHGIPLKRVYDEAREAAHRTLLDRTGDE